MIQTIPFPSATDPKTADWQQLLNLIVKVSGSFYFVHVTASTGSNQPVVKRGSKFEINGSFFEVTADESITGWNDSNNWYANGNQISSYIYARADNSGIATFLYSKVPPNLDAVLGGFFNGNDRCLAQVTRASLGTSAYELSIIAPQWRVPMNEKSALKFNEQGELSFKFPVLTNISDVYALQEGEFGFLR